MSEVLTRIVCVAIVTQLMFGCAMMPISKPITDLSSAQHQRLNGARLALQQLDEIDTLVKLDNQQLAQQITSGLKTQAEISGNLYFRNLVVRFNKQIITLDSMVDIADNTGQIISASVYGEVFLEFSSSHLTWLPRFEQLQVNSTDFIYGDGNYSEPNPELNQLLLQQLNTQIADELTLRGNNRIGLNLVPLAEVEVGATLPGFGSVTATGKQALKGNFVVAGSAILIEPAVTTVALNLEFLPGLSVCSAEITVSRAVFAGDIKSREPIALNQHNSSSEDLHYFFSEISGVKRPMTIIHYWFADGRPLATEELDVGPSQRWRTWSSKGRTKVNAIHWEVLVVEKETGCILHSQSLSTLQAGAVLSQGENNLSDLTFSILRDEFRARTSNFFITKQRPEIALIETRRAFLLESLKASMANLDIETTFNQTSLPVSKFSAELLGFVADNIVCEQHDCPPQAVCITTVNQCKRLQDTRDCLSCQFRNPLNNRCVSEGSDPKCEAAKNRQNKQYNRDWSTCIENAEDAMQSCEILNTQAAQSCEIGNQNETSACEAVRDGIAAIKNNSPMAILSARAKSNGRLSATFSNFSLEGDFSRFKQDILFHPDFELSGEMEFRPSAIPLALASCISTWSGPFSSHSVTSGNVDSLRTNLSQDNNIFTAVWSGYVAEARITPSPIESLFVGNPNLLADCGVGLTINNIQQAINGDDKSFFNGLLRLEIQPLPSSIRLLPAILDLHRHSYSGDAVISSTHVRYDIKNRLDY